MPTGMKIKSLKSKSWKAKLVESLRRKGRLSFADAERRMALRTASEVAEQAVAQDSYLELWKLMPETSDTRAFYPFKDEAHLHQEYFSALSMQSAMLVNSATSLHFLLCPLVIGTLETKTHICDALEIHIARVQHHTSRFSALQTAYHSKKWFELHILIHEMLAANADSMASTVFPCE